MEYNFEYMNQKYANKLVGILFLTFFIILFGTLFLSIKLKVTGKIIFICCFISAFAIPIIIYRQNRKKIKQIGFAKIYDTYTEFTLEGIFTKINYIDIKDYLVQNYNGTLLNLKLKDGSKFSIASTNAYCNSMEFDKFCTDFEDKLNIFQKENQVEIIRKKSFFERKWIFYFLVIFTLAIVIILVFALLKGRQIPMFRLFAAVGPLLVLWGNYFSAKRRR